MGFYDSQGHSFNLSALFIRAIRTFLTTFGQESSCLPAPDMSCHDAPIWTIMALPSIISAQHF